MQYQATGRWNDEALLRTLTTPELAQEFWHSRMADELRQEFAGREATFLAYLAQLHRQHTRHPSDAKRAWAPYTERAATNK